MISEISIYQFKMIFNENYGQEFIDGFHLYQNPLNVVKDGVFKLHDNYADEDIYIKIPILKDLFEDDEKIYLYTDHAYYESNIFILESKDIKGFIKSYYLDFFSNEPLFISFSKDIAFGYCLEGIELNSGIFFQLDLKYLRERNTKSLLQKFVNVLSYYYHDIN